MSEVTVSGTGLSESTLLDLEDMPALPCESGSHNDPAWKWQHDNGPATHYAQMRHECPSSDKRKGDVYPICARRALYMMQIMESGQGIHCIPCNGVFESPWDWIVVVGTIAGKRKK